MRELQASEWVAITDEWAVLTHSDQYQCEHCRLVYNKVNDEDWSDVKAKEEHDAAFPYQSLGTAVYLCDDCFKECNKWWNEEVIPNN